MIYFWGKGSWGKQPPAMTMPENFSNGNFN